MTASPRVHAARARVAATQAGIGPAGARPDPMLMAGIQNFPVSEPGFSDFMTMKMVGVSLTVPYPGKLGLQRRAAEQEVAVAAAELDDVRREVVQNVRIAYYDLAYADRALEILERNRVTLLNTIGATEARYAVGSGGQPDVLRARTEAARLGEQASALHEERRAVLARLNALLDRPSDAPVLAPAVPTAIIRAAVADTASEVRFVSATLGARAAGSPLPPVDSLAAMAIRHSPALRAQAASVAAQATSMGLARRAHLPDFDVSLSYGQRDGFSDMVSATVSMPIPLQRARKQDQLVTAARSELAAVEAERHELVNVLRAEVARLVAALEGDRAQLALYKRAVLPQAHATLEATLAGYQAGRSDFLSLLDAQTTLFNYETAYYRALTGFAKTLAELEQIVGTEVL